MKMNEIEDDAQLKRAFSSLAGTTPPGTPETHPSPERIYDAVRGKLPPAELRAIVEHLAECPDCAEEWRLAVAFEEEGGASAPAVPSQRGFPRLVAVAATVLVALLGVGLWWTTFRAPEAPVYRAAGDAEIVSLLAEGDPLDRDEPVLRWEVAEPEAADGTTYDLLVTTADLEMVAEASDLPEPRYEIPSEALAELPPGTGLLWRVEALSPDGSRVTSPTFVTPIE